MLSEPIFNKIKKLKAGGATSGEISKKLQLSLEVVNHVFLTQEEYKNLPVNIKSGISAHKAVADQDELTKICWKCKKELKVTEFRANYSTPDGLLSVCNKCFSIYENKHANISKKEEKELMKTIVDPIKILNYLEEKELIREYFCGYVIRKMKVKVKDTAFLLVRDALYTLKEKYILAGKAENASHAQGILFRLVLCNYTNYCREEIDAKWLAKYNGYPPPGELPPSVIHERERHRKYSRDHKVEIAASHKIQREKMRNDPEKWKAHLNKIRYRTRVREAVRKGYLSKTPCKCTLPGKFPYTPYGLDKQHWPQLQWFCSLHYAEAKREAKEKD